MPLEVETSIWERLPLKAYRFYKRLFPEHPAPVLLNEDHTQPNKDAPRPAKRVCSPLMHLWRCALE